MRREPTKAQRPLTLVPDDDHSVRAEGKLTTWHDDKGYGFITPLAGGEQVFVHIKAFGNRSRRPVAGEVLSYALSTDKQGRPRAVKAALAGDQRRAAPKQAGGTKSMLAAAIFLGAIGGATVTGNIPPLVFGLYLAASLITFAVYAADKAAAVTGAWRTKENTLHLLALVGGWPGALIAQQKLRHKSRKTAFRAVFWTTVLANCAALVWLSTPTGTAMVKLWIVQARHSLAI